MTRQVGEVRCRAVVEFVQCSIVIPPFVHKLFTLSVYMCSANLGFSYGIPWLHSVLLQIYCLQTSTMVPVLSANLVTTEDTVQHESGHDDV